jgi:SAM-dependent methyltransferase
VRFGLALVCFGNLLLSILLTRLFSATMFYHFTFLAVSLAMFGVAASGVYVFLNGERLGGDPSRTLAWACNWFAITTVVATIYSLANPIDVLFYFGTSRVPDFQARQFWQLVLLIVVAAAPFFFSGVVVSLCITAYSADINRVYFADLVGAACAALLAGLFLRLLGGPSALLAVAVLALAAGYLFRPRRAAWLSTLLMAAFVGLNVAFSFVVVPSGKGVASEKVVFESWNIFSRVTVDASLNIKIDASASTQINNLDSLRPGAQQGEITALAHAAFPGGADRVLIIGPGGGRDIMHALAAGARSVTGVELNPIIVEQIMRGRFAARSGRLYFDPRVRVVVDDGRSYVRRSTSRFDVIQASLVDTFAATAAGAFALSENTLYTRDAFEDYFEHLTDGGVLTMTRWHTGSLNETARLLLLAAAGLERIGVPTGEARSHLFYAIAPKNGLGTFIAGRSPLADATITALETLATANGWTTLVSPRTSGTSDLEKLVDGGPYGPLVAAAREDISPPTDDRPFFFYYKRLGDLFRGWHHRKMNDPSLWILVSLGSVLALAVVFIMLPLAMRAFRRGVDSPEPTVDKLLVLAYFGLVGFAFMALEIGLLQRMTLFLGHPSYSLVVVLFSLLLATGVGSYLSARIPARAVGAAMLVSGVALAVVAAFYGYGLIGLIHAFIGQSITVRILIAVALMIPAGALMGTMIPQVVRVLAARDSRLVPWGWGVNGATSVLGTVLSTVIAIYGGFSTTFAVGALLYAAAGGGGYLLTRRLGRAATP